ncbi:hypothetical protein Sa4125_33220 [Aureimonas sp. SA4125]|nr:hypothetical protein [Aureimonas sp. SA4125]BDA85780.1 hypothetical protein Sa4125_33220 [Aureimonas sp. SA4125]
MGAAVGAGAAELATVAVGCAAVGGTAAGRVAASARVPNKADFILSKMLIAVIPKVNIKFQSTNATEILLFRNF